MDVPISIVTPTLNAERYLAECLVSVRNQEYPALEHLVVDGGSTDGTAELVRASEACWISRPGLRQSAAINAGFQLAHGAVVAWLNADDLYLPGTLAEVASRFRDRPELDLVYGDCDVIGARGEIVDRMRPGKWQRERLLRYGNSVAQPAVFLRREVFDKIGLLDESLEYGMDFDLWLRAGELHAEYVPRVLAAFRWHRWSKTARNTRRSWGEALRIIRRHGGGWTAPLVWAYGRAHFTLARVVVAEAVRARLGRDPQS